MRRWRKTLFGWTVLMSAFLAGCGTPKEKTAPCKRPANLSSYAPAGRIECGPMTPVNADPSAALEAIDVLKAKAK